MSGLSVGSRLTSTTSLGSGFSGLSAGGGLYFNGFNSPVLNLNFTTGVLDPRITFSRPSNATLYDSTGKLTYAPNNLTLQSEDFSSGSWTKAQATVSANSITAPNGTLTADTLLDTAVTNIHYAYQLITSYAPIGKTFIVSAYAKANTLNYATIGVTDISTGGNYAVAVFNLSNGTVSTSGAAGTGYAVSSPVITSVGDGWYRCSVVCTVGSSAPFLATAIGVNKTGVITGGAGGMESYLGNGSGIYIWGDQTEIVTYQTTPSTYITTTSAAYYGPRFDYNPTTLAANGLLIEEARTNSLLQSENFTASWNLLRMTVSADATTSPAGTVTADQLLDTAVAGTHVTIQTITKAASSLAYTASVYLKANVRTLGELRMSDQSGNGVKNTFDLSNGTIGSPSAFGTGFTSTGSTITSVGNGWYRVNISCTTNTSTTLGHEIYIADAAGNISYTGNGSGFYAWGAQLEAGAFATSYIPTAAASVARAADDASMTGTNFSSWYNQTEGTFVANFNSYRSTGFGEIIGTNDGTSNNRIDIGRLTLNGYFAVVVAGVEATISSNYPPEPTSSQNIAGMAFAVNNVVASANGLNTGTTTSVTIPAQTQLLLGRDAFNRYFGGTIKSIQYYNKRLPNATLQTLTAPNLTAALALNLDFTTTGTLDPRITFSRPSNATMYDSTGRVTYAPNNLALYSQEFDNAAWVKLGSSVSANVVVAPNGTMTADKITEDTSTGVHIAYETTTVVSGTSYVFSVYAKAAGRSLVQIVSVTSFSIWATFDLNGGSVTNTVAGVASISPAGDGWYRISIVANSSATSSTNLQIRLVDSGTNASYTGNGTSGVYVWGAQLEAVTYQTLPGSYVATTSAAYYGPRFTYDPVTLTAQGLLIEEARTNICPQSQNFANVAWSTSNVSVAQNVVGPDGVTNSAATLTANGAGAAICYQAASFLNATTYTVSAYFKAGTANYGYLASYSGVTDFGVMYNVLTGTVVGNRSGGGSITSSSITAVGGGWYRAAFTFTSNGTSGSYTFVAGVSSTGNLNFNTAPSNGATVLVYGYQHEAGAFATSYIPTVASSVARSADTASMTGTNFSSWYNQSEGTMCAQVSVYSVSVGSNIFTASDNTTSNRIYLANTAAGLPHMRAFVSGVDQGIVSASGAAPATANTLIKMAGAYAVNNAAFTRDGLGVGTSSSFLLPVVSRAYIGLGADGTTPMNGTIKSIQYYNVRASNDQLQTLTT